MQVKSGQVIKVTQGNKTIRGFAQSDFNTEDPNTDFEIREIKDYSSEKSKDYQNSIGDVVGFNTGKASVEAESEE